MRAPAKVPDKCRRISVLFGRVWREKKIVCSCSLLTFLLISLFRLCRKAPRRFSWLEEHYRYAPLSFMFYFLSVNLFLYLLFFRAELLWKSFFCFVRCLENHLSFSSARQWQHEENSKSWIKSGICPEAQIC